jgi:hypothetical protein
MTPPVYRDLAPLRRGAFLVVFLLKNDFLGFAEGRRLDPEQAVKAQAREGARVLPLPQAKRPLERLERWGCPEFDRLGRSGNRR